MTRFVQVIILLAAALFIGVSATMNAVFLSSFGRTPLETGLLATISVAGDAVKGVLPVILVRSIMLRAWGHATMTTAMLTVVIAMSLTSGLGFAALIRGNAIAAQDAESAALFDRQRDLAVLERRLEDLTGTRTAVQIKAEMETVRLGGYTVLTKSCQEVTAAAGRRVCAALARLQGELAAARERDRLLAQRTELRQTIDRLTASGGGRDSDPQASVLASMLGVEPTVPRLVLTAALAVVLELGSILLILLASGPAVQGRRGDRCESASITEPAVIPPSVDRLDWQRRHGSGNLQVSRGGGHGR